MTQTRLRPPSTSADGPAGPPADDVIVSPPRGQVHVSHGVYSHPHPLGGMTVRQARSLLSERMNIAPEAVAVVDGQEVGDDTVLQEGAALMFVREAGEKGRSRAGGCALRSGRGAAEGGATWPTL